MRDGNTESNGRYKQCTLCDIENLSMPCAGKGTSDIKRGKLPGQVYEWCNDPESYKKSRVELLKEAALRMTLYSQYPQNNRETKEWRNFDIQSEKKKSFKPTSPDYDL